MRLEDLLNVKQGVVAEPVSKTIEEARQEIWRKRRVGAYCPCCGQKCRVYRRTITAHAAAWLVVLVRLWRETGGQWIPVKTPELSRFTRGGDYAKLAHWGLIEQQVKGRAQTRQSGMWRPTSRGVAFVDDQERVPQYCHIYLNKVMEFTGVDITINQALGRKFDYNELLLDGAD